MRPVPKVTVTLDTECDTIEIVGNGASMCLSATGDVGGDAEARRFFAEWLAFFDALGLDVVGTDARAERDAEWARECAAEDAP